MEIKEHKHSFTAGLLKNMKYDIPSGLVVFLVALPLCLGIALASGAPLFAGLITGIVGGIVVSFISGSQMSVSGPAAGLTVIVLSAIEKLPNYNTFLLAIVIAGVLQLVMGLLKAGSISAFFPSSVIKGMLAAIGLILILKQIPHALGYDKDFFGDESFFQADGENTFSELLVALTSFHKGALIISVISLAVLVLWEKPLIAKNKYLKLVPGALIVVVLGVLLNQLFAQFFPALLIESTHLVQLPVISSFSDLKSQLSFPSLEYLQNKDLYIVAVTIAIVASLESLLSVEATDKLDPQNRISSTNRELKAQGIGNVVAGMLGGLPMTAVIVRSSANINAGAKTRLSSFFHGIFLLLAVLFLPRIINQVPYASLAAVLLVVGFKLTKPSLYKNMYKLSSVQFVPFIVTVVAILFTDLLVGISIGLVFGIFYLLKQNHEVAYFLDKKKEEHTEIVKIELSEHVTFLNKGSIISLLKHLPENSIVEIDGTHSHYIDYDILELIENYKETAKNSKIELRLINIPEVSVVSAH
jgi:MFS superfamily sulfate permease-like transporter